MEGKRERAYRKFEFLYLHYLNINISSLYLDYNKRKTITPYD